MLLETLLLAGNRITELKALAPLCAARSLTHLALHGNPVRAAVGFETFLLARCPSVTLLDDEAVSDASRRATIRPESWPADMTTDCPASASPQVAVPAQAGELMASGKGQCEYLYASPLNDDEAVDVVASSSFFGPAESPSGPTLGAPSNGAGLRTPHELHAALQDATAARHAAARWIGDFRRRWNHRRLW